MRLCSVGAQDQPREFERNSAASPGRQSGPSLRRLFAPWENHRVATDARRVEVHTAAIRRLRSNGIAAGRAANEDRAKEFLLAFSPAVPVAHPWCRGAQYTLRIRALGTP